MKARIVFAIFFFSSLFLSNNLKAQSANTVHQEPANGMIDVLINTEILFKDIKGTSSADLINKKIEAVEKALSNPENFDNREAYETARVNALKKIKSDLIKEKELLVGKNLNSEK